MLNKLSISIKLFFRYLIKHPQFLLTLSLLLFIPFAFLYTGQQFLKVANDNQDRLEKNKIGVLHDVFGELVLTHRNNPEELQQGIENIVSLNPDITKFRVVKSTPEGLNILAALDTKLVGSLESKTDLYNFSSLESTESLIFPYHKDGARYWQSFRSLKTIDGEQYFIFTETSFAQTDKLFATKITQAYYWLLATLLVVVYLAYRHLRLIDYGYLYQESQLAINTRDLFTNMVTHEMRAPLTAIRGYASMIHEDKEVKFDAREQAVKIEQSANRLLLIVNDLLEVARLQSGKLKIEMKETDICALIRNVIDSLGDTAREKGITLSHDLHELICSINTDEKRLHQILTNLINNSIKYTEAGSISVVLKIMAKEVEIRVKDTGMGIQAEDQKRLFAPFFRVESEDVSKISGSGLGMWITKQLVDLLGGKVAVESIKDVGTNVVVTLPK